MNENAAATWWFVVIKALLCDEHGNDFWEKLNFALYISLFDTFRAFWFPSLAPFNYSQPALISNNYINTDKSSYSGCLSFSSAYFTSALESAIRSGKIISLMSS